MLGTILTASDFEEILLSCDLTHGSFGITNYLNDIFRDFDKKNSRLELHFMEFIEINFPKIQGIFNLHKQIIGNFEEEEVQYKDYRVEYVYSYLLNKAEKKVNKKGSEDIRFIVEIDRKILIRTLEKLKATNYCSYTNVNKILWIFTTGKMKATDERIQWVDKASKSKGANYQTLFDFLNLLYKSEMPYQGITLCRAIANTFLSTNKQPLNYINLKPIYSAWLGLHKKKSISPRITELRKNFQ
jgi:hypothetical protein